MFGGNERMKQHGRLLNIFMSWATSFVLDHELSFDLASVLKIPA